jgi:cytochrome c biogenesis protein ResB
MGGGEEEEEDGVHVNFPFWVDGAGVYFDTMDRLSWKIPWENP